MRCNRCNRNKSTRTEVYKVILIQKFFFKSSFNVFAAVLKRENIKALKSKWHVKLNTLCEQTFYFLVIQTVLQPCASGLASTHNIK